jgi:hypothetical protein
VTIRRWILLLPLSAMLSLLAACGGGSTFNVQNPPPPPPSNVSIAFQPAPSGSILISATIDLTAVVTDDSSNAGVDWSVTCSNPNNCGKLTALHTASGQVTTYTPPSTLSGNSQMINIVAFATADHTQNVAAPITVTAFGVNLKGNYVLQAQGVDGTSGPYQFAGVIALDGNGGVASGEQTVNFYDQDEEVNALVSKSDPITGGSYFLGPDGRGTITIKTNDQDVGQEGVETFSFVSLSTSHALIAQTDFTESATGTMDLQTSTTAPSGGYAFVVSGTDIASASPTAIGGILNIDSPNTISGKGSVTDQNLAGTLTVNQKLSGALSAPDAFGAVTLNLTVPGFPSATTFQFTGYIVDDTHIKLAESDNGSGAGSGSTGGVAVGQGSATGTFADTSSFSGVYVFGVLGTDLTSFIPATLTSVGLFTADGAGGLANGFTDTFLQSNGNQPPNYSGAQISAAFSGTYTVDTKGTGRVRAVFNHFAPHVTPGISPLFFFYLTGNGNPPLVLDGGDGTGNYPSVGAGIAYPQSTAPLTFGGRYGFSVTQQNGSENDGTGQMTADAAANTVSGSLDINSGFSTSFDDPFSDTFQPPSANGRFAGTLFNSTAAVEYYAIDSNQGFFVETDLVDPGTFQVSLGYYSLRAPVCDNCP